MLIRTLFRDPFCTGVIALWAIAALAFLFHAAATNPHTDTQILTSAFQFLQAVSEGNVTEHLLGVRKYPFLPSLLLSLLYAVMVGIFLVTGRLRTLDDLQGYLFTSPWEMHVLTRLVIVGAAIVTIIVTYRIARRILGVPASSPVLVLLLGSPMFFLFSTAIRPHMLATAATLVAFERSLAFTERKTLPRALAAFGAAAIAASMLHSGVFAVIFPVWAYMFHGDRLDWRRLYKTEFRMLCGFFMIATAMLGYPSLFNVLLGQPIPIDFDTGYIQDAPKWTGEGFSDFLQLMLGSELILAFTAILGGIVSGRELRRKPAIQAILLYAGFFLLAFGMYGGSSPRFFLPLLPLLALLGAPALLRWPRLRIGVSIFSILLLAKVTMLGLQPNAYERVASFVHTQTTGVIASAFPPYYLGIPPTRASIGTPMMMRERYYLSLSEDLPGARPFTSLEHTRRADVLILSALSPVPTPENWRLCLPPLNTIPHANFLWDDAPWQLWTLPLLRELGPAIAVYCRQIDR